MGILSQNYEIIRELGRGGMGAVFLANDKRLDREVAIKILQLDPSLDSSSSAEIIQRFQKEAKAIAKLNHPSIVSIYDIGEENNQYYMVIELLEGQALSNSIERKERLPIGTIVDIGVQICSALSYAHKNGIVHRDIKPANIMFSKENVAKLTDFGIAQLGNDKLGLTQAGSILGSILYIPPEQLIDSRKVDNRADIYSLGVTLFQLCTGRLPFEGESVAEVITKILNQDIPSLRNFNPEVPTVLDNVILKAMKKEPVERFEDVADFGKALSDVSQFLKNPDYKPEPIDNNTFSGNGSKHKTKPMLSQTERLPSLEQAMSGNVSKTPTVPLNPTVVISKKSKSKTSSKSADKNQVLLVIGAVTAVIIGLVVILTVVFGDDKKPDKPSVKESRPVPTYSGIKPANPTLKVEPSKPAPVASKPAEVKQTNKPVATSKPAVVTPVKKPVLSRPVTVTRPASRPVRATKPFVPNVVKRPAVTVTRPKPAVVKKVTKPTVAAPKKSIGEGY